MTIGGLEIVEEVDFVIGTVKDYPQKGLTYPDITTLIKHPVGFHLAIRRLTERYSHPTVFCDIVVGVETCGLIFGGAVAFNLGKGFVPIRRSGTLSLQVIAQDYERVHGRERIEIRVDALQKGEKVLLLDDLLVTGETALASAALVERLGGIVVELAFVVDVSDAGGRKRLMENGYSVFTLTRMSSKSNLPRTDQAEGRTADEES